MNLGRRRFLGDLAVTSAALAVPTVAFCELSDDIRIDADFPGGNITVRRTDGSTVYVEPDLRDTQKGQWWFYWCLRLRAPAGKPVRIVFTEKNPIGVRGPAESVDGGKTWKWMGAKAVRAEKTGDKQEWSFEAQVPDGKEEIRYAFCIPYLESHLKSFLHEHKDDPSLKVEELCRSRKGRPVELIRAGCLDPNKSSGTVILTSRHHACESMGTYVMEGFLRAALAEDGLGKRWRSKGEVLAVPFMDKDGVEAGDQGKNRSPHDHNRDYNEKPLYPEVAALTRLGDRTKGTVKASLDLHCPGIRGEWHDRVYLVGAQRKANWEQQQAFAKTLEKVQTGPIKFRSHDCLAFGTSWNTNASFAQGRSNAVWAGDTFTDARLVGTLEVAYADALGDEVNADSARALGKDLAVAMADLLDGR